VVIDSIDGRTISSFRIVLAMYEEADWKKPFCNALDKSDRKKFDDQMMFDIRRLYISQLALLCYTAYKVVCLMAVYPIILLSQF
jgi:hypothetical protein